MDPQDLALYDTLPPEQRAALDAAVANDEQLARALAAWRGLRAHLGVALDEAVPDRTLLVLAALAEEDPATLAPEEHARWESARSALDAARVAHPALDDALRQVRRDRDLFEATWAEFEDAPAPPEADRAARPAARLSDSARRHAARHTNGHAPDRRPTRSDAPRRYRDATWRRWGWRLAAAAAVVVMGVFAVQIALRDSGLTVVRTGPGESHRLTLADGSRITLDENTAIQVVTDRDDDNVRRARMLAGRVLFEVVRQPSDPFVVTTPVAEVTVLGTTFAVETEEYESEVWLVRGVVELAPRGRPAEAVRLAPGEESRVLGDRAPDAPRPARLDRALDWTGTLFFQREPLGEVVDRLEERFGVPLEVAPALRDVVISVQEDTADGLRPVLLSLARGVDATVVEIDGGGLRIEPSGP